MAEYIVTAPDGKKYRISGDGTAEEALAHFQNTYAQQKRFGPKDPAVTAAARKNNPELYDPNYQYNPTSGMKAADKFDAGAGKAMFDVGRGIKQLGAGVADFFAPRQQTLSDLITDAPVSRVDQLRAKQSRQAEQDAPLMKSGWAKAGNIAGGAAVSAPAMMIPGAQGFVGSVMTGAGLGAVQPVGTGESRAKNAMFGGAGGAVGYGIGKGIEALVRAVRPSVSNAASAAASPGTAGAQSSVNGSLNASAQGGGSTFGSVGDDLSAGLNDAQRRALEAGSSLGMKATPGQATGSKALQQLEAKLESQPMTSGPFNAIKSGNQKALNRVFAKALGETSDVVDDATIGKFLTRADKVYEDVADKAARQIDPDSFLTRLSGIESESEGLLPASLSEHPLVKKLMDFAGKGEITGEQAQNLASKLGKVADQNMRSPQGDRELGQALFKVKDIADDLLEQGLSGNRLQAFRNVRSQYRNFSLMSRNGTLNPSTGNVSGATMANTLQRLDRRGFLGGANKSDLYQASRFAQAFRPIVGDSGTATRSALTDPLSIMMSAPFNVAARAYTSSPAVNLAVGTQSAVNGIRPAVAPLLKPIAPYAPYFLPGAGGLFGTYAAQ